MSLIHNGFVIVENKKTDQATNNPYANIGVILDVCKFFLKKTNNL